MRLFKRHIDKLRDQDDLPEELSWEHMQEGVYDKMSIKSVENAKPNKFMYFLLFSTGFLLTLSIACSLINDVQEVYDQNLTDQVDEVHLVNNHDIAKTSVHELAKKQIANIKSSVNEAVEYGENHLTKAKQKQLNSKSLISEQENFEQIKSNQGFAEVDHKSQFGKKVGGNESNTSKQINDEERQNQNNKQGIVKEASEPNVTAEVVKRSSRVNKNNSKVLVEGKSKQSSSDKNYSNAVGAKKSSTQIDRDLLEDSKVNKTGSKESVVLNVTESISPDEKSEINRDDSKENKGDNLSQRNLSNQDDEKLLAFQQINGFAIGPLDYEFQIESIPAYEIIKLIKAQNDKFTLSTSLGVNPWGINFSQLSQESEKATNEKSLLGSFGSLRLTYDLGKSLYVSTGIQYVKLQSKFNKTAIKNYSETRINQLIEELTNPITGDVQKIYGDLELNVIETRKVQHFNAFDMLSIPIVIGYRGKLGRITPSIGIGAMYNLSLSSTGKTDVQGDILDYTDGINSPYKSKFGLTPTLELGLDYWTNGGFVIGLDMQYQHLFKQWNQIQSFATKPRILNIGFKVGKTF